MAFSFSLMRILFFLIFAFVAAAVIITIVQKIAEEAKNSQAPVQTVSAKIVCKRTSTSGMSGTMQMNGMSTGGTVSTQHYVTFEAPDGSRLELPVSGKEYGMLAEGDYGELTYQRKRYVGFNRQATPEQLMYSQNIANQMMQAQQMQDPVQYGQQIPASSDQIIQTNGEQRGQF